MLMRIFLNKYCNFQAKNDDCKGDMPFKATSCRITYLCRKDLQGNIIALIDNNGNTVVEYKYDAWGNHKVVDANGNEITSSTHIGNLNPFRYRGYYYDAETGLYFLQTRYYDPDTGRFLNRDSVSYADPQTINGLNLYTYCLNNPVKYVDPSGHFVISAIFALAILGAAAGATVGGVVAHNVAKDAGVEGAALAGYTILGILGGGVAGAALGASAGYLIGGTAIGGVLALAGGGTVSVGYAAAEIALLGLGYLLAKWVPGSWPGDDPTVPPGDDFEWRGNGPIGSDKGAWYNPFTKDSLHPDLNHPVGIPPHWDWVNILKIIVRIFKI